MNELGKRVIFCLSILSTAAAAAARDTITQARPLAAGDTLVSSAGTFALGFFSPPGPANRVYVGIWYNNISAHTVVWVANRAVPLTGTAGTLSVTAGGALAVAAGNGTVVWSTPTPSTAASDPVAQLLDCGNLVVRGTNAGGGGAVVWQSFDYPTDTLLPGMKLGPSHTAGLERNLTAWRSDDDPAPGTYALAMDLRGDPQLALWSGTKRLWRSGPWDGYQFAGVPETRSYTMFNFTFVNDADEVYYSYAIIGDAITTRLVVNRTGVTQRFVWLPDSGTWSEYWYTPKGPCDGYGVCGAYGLCDPNASLRCRCVPGFAPRVPSDWALRDWSGGCARETVLDCRGGTDGFEVVHNALVPDTASGVAVDRTMSLDACRAACLANCSCTGYASADIRNGGSGCIIWASEMLDMMVFVDGGQDLFIRLAAADLRSISDQSSRSKGVTVAMIVSIVLGIMLLGVVVCYAWKKKKNRRGLSSFHEYYNEESTRDELELPLFDFETIAAATDNFPMENKLGEGGFGPVYKGSLVDGKEIAVKTLAKNSIQGLDEFKNEITLIAKLQHRNLVRLLGCCIQGDERMLIYEYMPNKSLDAFLFDKENRVLLNWQTRYHIIEGIARGLLYLHEDSRFRIIHRDLKASNVLLDGEMTPKISDFGMARIFGGDETKAKTMRVVGTYGYMSPEYAMDGIFSVKSDVFSFGVLVLEIISGMKNKGVYLSEPEQYLLGHAWSLWKEGTSLQLIDESMGYSFSMTQVIRCIKVGLLCVQELPEDRPTMSMVVLMLNSDIASIPEPKEPGFVARKGYSDADSSSSRKHLHSTNDLTITGPLAR